MEQKNDCMYCNQNSQLQEAMVEVYTLKYSRVYLLKDQAFRGRCVVAYRGHATELFQLSEAERNGYMGDVSRVAEAIQRILGAHKLNYAILGDVVPHLHFHLIPRYPDGPLWGKHFYVKPVPSEHLPDKEFAQIFTSLRQALIN